MCHRSEAVATPAKYKHDILKLVCVSTMLKKYENTERRKSAQWPPSGTVRSGYNMVQYVQGQEYRTV